MKLSKKQANRYARQIILSEIGEEGQKKLINAKVLVIGLGGLGSSCAIYLGAAGVGNLGILDFDKVGLDNLHRQVIHSEKYINHQKTESAKDRISQINSDVKVIDYRKKLTPENAVDLISNYDIIADCTENLGIYFSPVALYFASKNFFWNRCKKRTQKGREIKRKITSLRLKVQKRG